MGSHDASEITMESIRQRMLEVEQIHRRGKKVAITDTLVKDVVWLFRRIGFLTNQVKKLEGELETLSKRKKELSVDNSTSDRIKMLMDRVRDAEEKMRAAQQEGTPLKRENKYLKQELKFMEVRAEKAERRAEELAVQLNNLGQEEGLSAEEIGSSADKLDEPRGAWWSLIDESTPIDR